MFFYLNLNLNLNLNVCSFSFRKVKVVCFSLLNLNEHKNHYEFFQFESDQTWAHLDSVFSLEKQDNAPNFYQEFCVRTKVDLLNTIKSIVEFDYILRGMNIIYIANGSYGRIT